MRIWKLFSAVMVIAILASVIGVAAVSQRAQAAVATNCAPPAPKVTAFALPFAWVDTALPVVVIVKNEADSTIDDPMISIDGPQGLILELPEEADVEPWWGIQPNGYTFAIWFVSWDHEGDITIFVHCAGTIGGALVVGSDSVEIEVLD